MNLSGLVSVSGKPGLYKMLAQNKAGFILESLDDLKTKLIVNLSTSKLATLEDITVYGHSEDLKLSDIFLAIKNYEGEIPEPKADAKALKTFFETIAPDYDEEKVYTSDMKKIVGWYHIIKQLPLFNEDKTESETDTIEEVTEVKKPVKEKQKPAKEKAIVAPKTKSSASVKKSSGKNP